MTFQIFSKGISDILNLWLFCGFGPWVCKLHQTHSCRALTGSKSALLCRTELYFLFSQGETSGGGRRRLFTVYFLFFTHHQNTKCQKFVFVSSYFQTLKSDFLCMDCEREMYSTKWGKRLMNGFECLRSTHQSLREIIGHFIRYSFLIPNHDQNGDLPMLPVVLNKVVTFILWNSWR